MPSGFFWPLHTGVHTPRSFSFPSSPSVHFSPPLLPSAGPLTNPLGSAPSRTLWGASSREFFGKPPLTDPLANPLPRTLWHSITTPATECFPPFSLSPLGLAKRVADVRSPERACRSEPELVSEAAKRVGVSLGGRSTTTYRTIDARLPSDCERPLFINSHPSLLSFFPKNAS